MYSTSGGVANGGRIHNPRPDPAEVGPPRRVNRDESHVGEMVASSKRRIAWTFTLGDSDTVHEVVLVHSILSYKKVVEFDGRQMHFSSTATPGDWSYAMFLDGTKYAIEVRINDLESADVPKYDLVIDRVPFRRWDVYRRRKPVNGPSNTFGIQQHQYQQRGSITSSGDSFGKHKWGPGGMTAPPPMEPSPQTFAQRNSGSFYRDGSSSNSGYQSPPSRAPGQFNGVSATVRAPAQSQATTSTAPPTKKPPQKEIDLLGDFGDANVSTVTAQQLIFDPLASTKIGTNSQQQPARTASNPTIPQNAPVQAQANARTASNPQMGFQQPSQQYVDPFASVAQPLPIKPTASSFNLDPYASQNTSYPQSNRFAPIGAVPTYPTYPTQQNPMARGIPMQQPPEMQGSGFPVGGGLPSQHPTYQPPKVGGGVGGVNYNISHLMNPMEVNNVRNPQETKTINIDPFAGMKSI